MSDSDATNDKNDDLMILSEYMLRSHFNETAKTDVKIYDKTQNTFRGFNQNQGTFQMQMLQLQCVQ